MRPTVMTGMRSRLRMAVLSAAKQLRPTDMPGMTMYGFDECTPPETLIASAPAASRSAAISTASSISSPPGT
jgi:hypothetical protein